jgi:hypothetical protein
MEIGQEFLGQLIKWDFEQSLAEPCIFVNHTTRVILLVYVDDIAAAATSKIQLQHFVETLFARFNVKHRREIEKILGARVTRNRKNRALYLDQEQYLTTVLDRFGIRAEKHKSKKIPIADYESLCLANEKDK